MERIYADVIIDLSVKNVERGIPSGKERWLAFLPFRLWLRKS